MNSERGWACLNEIDLRVPIPKPLSVTGCLKIGHFNYWEAANLGTWKPLMKVFEKDMELK